MIQDDNMEEDQSKNGEKHFPHIFLPRCASCTLGAWHLQEGNKSLSHAPQHVPYMHGSGKCCLPTLFSSWMNGKRI